MADHVHNLPERQQPIGRALTALPVETQACFPTIAKNESSPGKKLKRFPWFRTFEENAPRLIKLEPIQANLLAHLSAWTFTRSAQRDTIRRTLALP